ncbi:MAG: two-component regulator propeller domain-containing protein [Planctomycetota bacterium]|jgi:membrane protein implicated in regulation of membrane protease activity
MKTQKITRKMKPAAYSGLPALTLACMITIGMFALPAVVCSQTTEWTVYNVSNSPLPGDSICPLVFDTQGNLWIGTGVIVGGGRGLVKFDGENWTVYNTSNSGLPCNNILALALDTQENLWIGTSDPFGAGGGLAKFDGENWTVYTTANSGLPCKNVMSLTFDAQGNLWIGTGDPFSTSCGLARFDGENWTVYTTSNSGLPYHIVDALAFDTQGNLWIGTVEPVCGSEGGGLAKFDGENWTVYNKANSGLTSNDVWDLIFDAQGNLWIGTGDDYTPQGGGLAKFDGESWTVYHTSNSPLTWHMVTSLALDVRQNLWMGMCSAHTTTGGVARFDGENWLVFNEWNSGLPHVTATGLALDRQGNLWTGTYGGGLAVYQIGQQLPLVDFNGDGLVDIKDLLRLIGSWSQNDPTVDIAPPPFGDGIVDALDLELLMSYWGQPFDDPTLIAHWALDEAEGAFAYDNVGVNDAVVVGGTAWQPSVGQVSGALQLDGIDGCAVTSPVLNPAKGPFSVFAWIKGGAPGQAVISQQGDADWLGTDPFGGYLTTELTGLGRLGGPLLSQTVITDGQWHRIGFVWDGLHRTLYVDGIAVAQDTQANLKSSENGLYIGSGKDMAAGTFFSGLIDDVRIYNRTVKP